MGLVQFTFTGQIICESFLDFASHRAARLDLALDIVACSGSAARLTVAGQEALVDMFEMACSLGPSDCIVLDINRVETGGPAEAREKGMKT